MKLPEIIQGGMGVYVSTPFLARAVALCGGLGTVSGVAVSHVFAYILQHGDPGGHYRRALEAFPFPDIAERVRATYFIEGGIEQYKKYHKVPVFSLHPPRNLIELTICANFAMVWLAKEGHDHPISINYLEKVQMPHLYSFFGAMLADVDVITIGAGIPLQVPGILDAFASGRSAEYRMTVEGSSGPAVQMVFDPKTFFNKGSFSLKRPKFLPIVSSDKLAEILLSKKASGKMDGFVAELPTAGGHNAGPRGNPKLFNEYGEPIYGEKDKINFERLHSLGLPFWIGGALANPDGLRYAQGVGAAGIQAGSIFALAQESALNDEQKRFIRKMGFRNNLRIITSEWSPTGFPFKVIELPGTLSDKATYAGRKRICNLSYLVSLFRRPDGVIVSRCGAEPEGKYLHKGGTLEGNQDKRCLCNGLLSAVTLGHPNEPQIFTLGDDVRFLQALMQNKDDSYTVSDAMKYLLNKDCL